MEATDERLICKFEGYTPDGNMLMVDSNKHYKIVDMANCNGQSILRVGSNYSVRIIPGGKYLIEGFA